MSSPLSMQRDTAQDPARLIQFVSPSGDTGRSSVVANVAWILASARKRVCVVDWGTEAPRLHEYLEPFYVEELPIAETLGGDLAVAYASLVPLPEHTPSPVVERYDVPDAAGHIDVIGLPAGSVTESVTTLGAPLAEHYDPGIVVELRERLRSLGYDYVLIEGPTDTSDSGIARIAVLCDTAVVCFTSRQRAITEAADLARRVRARAWIDIEILPVLTQFDDRYKPRVEQIRSAIRAAFAEFLTGSGEPERPGLPNGVVEIPYQPYDTFAELLAVLVDEPGRPTSLTAAFERLANAVTKGAVTALSPVRPVVRARYRRGLGLESVEQPDRIVIAHAARDRAWADWARSELERAGAEIHSPQSIEAWLDAPEPPGLLVVSSPHLEGSRVGHDVAALLARVQGEGRTVDAAELRVADGGPEALVPKSISIVGGSEPQARARLLTHFGLIARPGAERAEGCRYPTAAMPVSNLVPRRPRFVGRDDDVEALRDQLLESSGAQPRTALTGAPGIGKTELALEYAHRFAYDYDLVWWIPAHDRQSILASFTSLAEKLPQGTVGDPASAALDALSSGSPYSRWLLIYDDADDPTVLEGLLPVRGNGHVLVTSRSAAPDVDQPPAIELGVLPPEDSIHMLCDRVPGLSPDDAQEVALVLDHLPLALHLAVAWLRETVSAQRSAGATMADAAQWAAREFLSRLEYEDAEELGGAAARVVGVVIDALRENVLGRAAVLLAQLCAFLSPQGVDLRLLRSPAMLAQLISAGQADTEALARDAGEVDRVLWTGSRFGLFDVDWGRSGSCHVHRFVQDMLRKALPPAEHRARQAQALAGLAAYAPTEVEEEIPFYKPRFAELQRHLVPSGALHSDDEAVRCWMVNQARYLFLDGNAQVWETAVDLIHKMFDCWTSTFGASDALRLRLAGQLANLYRALGHHQEALRLDDDALAGQRRSLRLTHPQALTSARGRGGDLRGLGRFGEAFEEDHATWEGFREALGDDHPDTRKAANNLALTMFLFGDVHDALALEQDNHDRRMRLFGPSHPDTWYSLCNIGAYLRELGRYDEALDTLRNALAHLHRLRPPNHPDELRIQRQLAITERWLGRASSAKERNGQALRGYREALGKHHPDTVACALSLAADHHALGDPRTAVTLATHCLQSYERELRLDGDHPFIALCKVGLGLYQSACGEVGEARITSDAGRTALRTGLGDTHPWALAAAIDYACVLATGGDLAQAAELTQSAHDGCAEFLGADHPYTQVAAHNLHLLGAGSAGVPGLQDITVDIPQT